MTTLDEMRARHDAIYATSTYPTLLAATSRAVADVPTLLDLIDSLTPLVQVALDFVHGEYDKDTLERLIDAADKLPWDTMRALGLLQEED